MRKALLLTAAIVVVTTALAAGFSLLQGTQPSSASHEPPAADGACSIPGTGTSVGNAAVNEPCVADFVALDAVTTGNTDSALGAVEECVSVATSAAFSIDVVADAVPDTVDPATDGIISWQAVVQFDNTQLTLNSVTRTAGTNLLGNDPDSNLFNPTPSTLQAGPPQVSAFGSQDTGGGIAAEEAIAGVLGRLNFTAGGASGLATVTLLESFGVNTTKLITMENETWGIGNFTGGANAGQFLNVTVAIGQACPSGPPDTEGPTTSGVAAAPSPTNGASTVTLSATVDDSATGGSNVVAAEYFVGATPGTDGNGTPMSAADGAFDEPVEVVYATINAAALADGDYTFHVHGQDDDTNWGATASTVLSVTPVPAGAETASISIIGGALFVQTNPVQFSTLTLNGSDQTTQTQPVPWHAGDATGLGAGWNVTVLSTDFVSGANSITVDNFKTKIDTANIITETGNTPPSSQATTYQPLSSTTPLQVLSAAAGEGMGTYQFTPDFQLTVPSETKAGDYQALMSVSINAGP